MLNNELSTELPWLSSRKESMRNPRPSNEQQLKQLVNESTKQFRKLDFNKSIHETSVFSTLDPNVTVTSLNSARESRKPRAPSLALSTINYDKIDVKNQCEAVKFLD